ncbi:hypothetical protein [Flaviflexus huanghaiensis]|uniref:hypothetical protein n=1 Tax=Flaviflexus huanghaiensis TaxID=1111473 RepID=UPI0015FA8FD8|nr:hypothetical protein [Flaviflexus huanghaiensis]
MDDNIEVPPPLDEQEAIRRQRRQFLLFAIAGLFMLVIAFIAGRTVKGWVSDDEGAPESPATAIVKVVEYEA